MKYPVGAQLPGKPGELGAALRLGLTRRPRYPHERDQPGALVTLEHRDRAVGRSVVADHEEVDALRTVVAEVDVDQVRGVADQEGHRQAHGRQRLTAATSPGRMPRALGRLSPEVRLGTVS